MKPSTVANLQDSIKAVKTIADIYSDLGKLMRKLEKLPKDYAQDFQAFSARKRLVKAREAVNYSLGKAQLSLKTWEGIAKAEEAQALSEPEAEAMAQHHIDHKWEEGS